MNQERVKRKLSAILSADVVGYSRLMGDDEAATVKTLETYKGVMFSLIKQHRGRVVDSPGDNLLAEFGSVVDAVQCAVSIQKELQTRNADLSENRRMEFRIGINLGDVIEEDDRIYGDGVNIAARLEALADPGGICVSKTAFDHIESKLPLGYEFLGDQTVKNIAKPVGAYKVLMETRVVDARTKREAKGLPFWRRRAILSVGIIVILSLIAVLYWKFYHLGPSIEPASIERMAHPLPDKPSIAVLPFTNMSGDPEQDYIGDGLSENIISALSVSSQIFVMARNATFTYKGTPVKPQQVAEDLGVQYILEGSIQKSGNQLRVTAQLIDALSGHHLWSEVYNREMVGLFDLQDEITKQIMVSLQAKLAWVGEDIRFLAKSTDNLEAWKHFIKGRELYEHFIEEDNAKARQHLERALELDPQYVPAMSQLGFVHLIESFMGWSDSPSASMNRAFELAQKAVELDDQDPMGHCLLGYVFLWQRQHEKAINAGKRAITLGPNFALVCGVLGHIMSFSGHFNDAIPILKKGRRLNPNLDPVFLIALTYSYIFLECYEEALEVCDEMEEQILNGRLRGYDWFPPLFSSWVYQELDREEEARAYMAEALKREPDLSSDLYKRIFPYKNQAHLERALDALRKAGMPEKTPRAVQENPSIAVLPFDDLSPEKDQEHFVLGLSEEILNYISNISGLYVTSKTSSFAFRDTNKTIKEIAGILERDYILEGSVRKAGDSLRINAQLIDVADDRHLWSETYDRELKDIFKIQEDIANNVADKLKLTLDAFQLLGGTESVEAYESYLIAKGQYYDFENSQALESIDKAIALDPGFALGWSLKSQIHIELCFTSPRDRVSLGQNEALKAARKAIELEPGMGQAYLALGSIHYYMNEFIESELAYQQGMGLITESINSYGYSFETHYAGIGYLRKAYELFEERMLNNTPDPPAHAAYMLISSYLGNNERAEEEYERGKAIFGDQWDYGHGYITNVRLGARNNLSVDEIPELPLFDPIWSIARENIEDPEKGLAELHRLYISNENLSAADLLNISVFSAYFGDLELSINAMEKNVNLSNSGMIFFWAPVFREVRQLPRFKKLMKEIGLVDYWKEYGWPDLCRPVGDDDFVCD